MKKPRILAAEELIIATDALRELNGVGRATETDRTRVKNAIKGYDKIKTKRKVRQMGSFVVTQTVRLPSRTILLVVGVLDGEPLEVGDVIQAEGQSIAVRSIELHNKPGFTTIGVDISMDKVILPGTVLTY